MVAEGALSTDYLHTIKCGIHLHACRSKINRIASILHMLLRPYPRVGDASVSFQDEKTSLIHLQYG